jgi:hypothetical protein
MNQVEVNSQRQDMVAKSATHAKARQASSLLGKNSNHPHDAEARKPGRKRAGNEKGTGQGVVEVDVERRKRRRTKHEDEKATQTNFALHRTLSNVLRRAEALFGEATTLERRLHVPLPDESAIPAEELEMLDRLHEKRLSDMVSSVCKKILAGIMANKWSWPFNTPVDPKMYPDYGEKVDEPMDFGRVKKALEGGMYKHPEQFVEHVRLVFRNARSYNKPGSDVHVMAKTLQEKFEDRYAASIVPRLVETQKQRETDKIELRQRMAEQEALGGREMADGDCAALIEAIDSLLADIDVEKIKAAAACSPVPRREKEALVNKFKEMDEGVLSKVLGIIVHHYPGVRGPNEVAFDVETLDSLCLRQVLSYVLGVEEKGIRQGNQWPPKAFIETKK